MNGSRKYFTSQLILPKSTLKRLRKESARLRAEIEKLNIQVENMRQINA